MDRLPPPGVDSGQLRGKCLFLSCANLEGSTATRGFDPSSTNERRVQVVIRKSTDTESRQLRKGEWICDQVVDNLGRVTLALMGPG
jgi:hypothetical protein